MATSKKDAKLASKILSDKKSSNAEKSVAASDLSQTKKGKKRVERRQVCWGRLQERRRRCCHPQR